MVNIQLYRDSTGDFIGLNIKDIPSNEWLRVRLGYATIEEMIWAQRTEGGRLFLGDLTTVGKRGGRDLEQDGDPSIAL